MTLTADPGLPIRCPAEQINTGSRVGPETKKDVKTWMACAQLCRERVGCRYWTWHHGHTCVTMTDAAKLHGNPNAVSGNRDCREKLKLKIACPANMVSKEQRLAKLALISMRPLIKIPKSEPFFSIINK